MGGRALLNAQKILEHAGVEPGMCVADFGCGQTGHLVLPASRQVGENGHVYAIDLVPGLLHSLTNRLAHHGVVNVTPVWGDFERINGIDLKDSTLDRIFLVNTLWVVHDTPSVLAEARRLLKPDGHVVIVDWHKRSNHPIAPPIHARTEQVAVMRTLASCGATSLHEFSPSSSHWGLMAPFA